MKKYLLLIPLLFGCTTKAMMNQSCYATVEVGESILDVEKSCGKPYTVHSNGGNADVYEYIERITFGQDVVETRRYYLPRLKWQGRRKIPAVLESASCARWNVSRFTLPKLLG